MNAIEKLFENIEELIDFEPTEKQKEADVKVFEFFDKLGISNTTNKKDLFFEIESLIGALEMESEKQGFMYGFKYAMQLVTCGIS